MIPCSLKEPDLATNWASRLGRFEQSSLLLCAAQNLCGAFLGLIMTTSMLCAAKGALG